MAVGVSSQFFYSGSIARDSSGVWIGCADLPGPDEGHPGAVGIRPEIRLAAGVVTLLRTEGPAHRPNPHYREWGPPMAEASFPAGPCLEDVLEDGDVLTVVRWGTADVALMVRRAGELVAALGAVAHGASGPEVHIEEDPRATDAGWYHIKDSIRRSDTRVIFLDASTPDSAAHLHRVREASAGVSRLVVAIHGADPERRRELNLRVSQSMFTFALQAVHYINIDSRFAAPDEWLAYVQDLPDKRPYDLWIRFTSGEGSTTLRENGYQFLPPWHLFVLKVTRWGIPGELTQLAVVRDKDGVTKENVIKSTELIARRDVFFRP